MRLTTAKGELTRPIKRLFPLELNYKFSKDDFDKVRTSQQTQQGSSTEMNKCKSPKQVSDHADERQNVVTKCGREVKRPDRLVYY